MVLTTSRLDAAVSMADRIARTTRTGLITVLRVGEAGTTGTVATR